MNAFVEHHNNSIQFAYRCFDRPLLNGLIQPFQQPERVLGFFNTYREGKRVTRRTLTEIADQFQYWPIGNTMKYVAIANARRGSSLITSFSSGKRRCRRPHSRDAGRGGAHACAVASSALQPLVRGQFQTEGP